MERTTLPGGVRLTVSGRPVPTLRMMTAEGRRMLLRQGTREADHVRRAHWFAPALTEPLHDGEWVLVTRNLPAGTAPRG